MSVLQTIKDKVKDVKDYVEEKIEYVQISAAKSMVRSTFENIFKNMSEELGIPLEKLRVGIEFVNTALYYAYADKDKFADRIPDGENGERVIYRVLDIDDFSSSIGIDLSGGTSAISLLIGERFLDLQNSEGVPAQELTIILKPDLANYEGKTVFKYSLPAEILKAQFPTCNGLPLAVMFKKVDPKKDMVISNLQKIRPIDIESEFLT